MGRFFILLCLVASPAMGQSISLSDFAAKVDERASLLGGYEGFLADPDPNRSMAALQIMLESGDDTLIRMALDFGIYSPDAAMRQTTLKAFMAGKPTIDLFFDGNAVSEEQMGTYSSVLGIFGGSVGVEKRASASFSLGDWQEDQGCYVNRSAPSTCLLRVNATTISLRLPGLNSFLAPQWVHLELNAEGSLAGSVTPIYQRQRVGPLKVTMRITE